jgi:hypothetical protein
MTKAILILMLLGFLVRCALADSWSTPKTTRIRSSCDRFTALVIPGDAANPEKPAKAHVYEGDPVETGRWQTVWAVTLTNPTAPAEVMLSNGGRYLVTFDNWGSVGYGNDSVAIYTHDGMVGKKISHYSIEQLLTKAELQNVRQTVSSRWWREHSHCFLDEEGGQFLCLWLGLGSRWMAWNLTSGELIDIKSQNELVKRSNERNRVWALQQMKERDGDVIGAIKFLTYLKDPRDNETVAAHRAATQPAAGTNITSSDD